MSERAREGELCCNTGASNERARERAIDSDVLLVYELGWNSKLTCCTYNQLALPT